jgi:hypothetical protein
MTPQPKAASTLYFPSGKTLSVVETVDAVTNGYTCPIPGGVVVGAHSTAIVTEPSGAKHWINLWLVERVGPA